MAAGVELDAGRGGRLPPRARGARRRGAVARRPDPGGAGGRRGARRRPRPRPGRGARAARARSGWGTRSPRCWCPRPASSASPAWARSSEHSRFTLVTAGGAHARAAWRSARRRGRWRRPPTAPRHGPPARAQPLERRGRAARAAARAVPDAARRARACSARTSRSGTSSARARGRPRPRPVAAAAAVGRRRRGPPRRGLGRRGGRPLHERGAACWSAVADVARRRAGWRPWWRASSDGPMPVAPGRRSPRDPELAAGFDHLVALDPPLGGSADPRLRQRPARPPGLGPGRGGVRDDGVARRARPAPTLAEVFRALRAAAARGRRARPRDGAARRRPLSRATRGLRPPRARAHRARA